MMAYSNSRSLFLKFACALVASLVTFAGVLMTAELLRQGSSDQDTDPSSRSSTRRHFIYQMEEYEGCGDCSDDSHDSGAFSKTACCKAKPSRKWGPRDGTSDAKLRMTPEAARNHPYLRRTPGIDYSQRSNSTNYVYLFPDPVLAPVQAPEPTYALPLFWDDYQQPYYAPWEDNPPDFTEHPPVATDYGYEGRNLPLRDEKRVFSGTAEGGMDGRARA